MTNMLIPAAAIATRSLDGQGQRHAAFIAPLSILKTQQEGAVWSQPGFSFPDTLSTIQESPPAATSSDKLKRLVTSSDLSKMDGLFFFFS